MNEITMTSEKISELVQQGIADVESPEEREEIRKLLVTPYIQMRSWDYTSKNEEEFFPCWIFLKHKKREVGMAYSEFGHGAMGTPWGYVMLEENNYNMDACWRQTFPRLWSAFGRHWKHAPG